MDHARMFDELLLVARRLRVRVRVEPFDTEPVRPGDLCRVHRNALVIIDASASLPDKVHALARALARLETDEVHTVPAIRTLLDRFKIRAPPTSNGQGSSDP